MIRALVALLVRVALAVAGLAATAAFVTACSSPGGVDGEEVGGRSSSSGSSDGSSNGSAERAADPDTDSAVPPDRPSLAIGAPGEPGRLVDATTDAGIDEALLGIRGHAVAVADVDGDGWDDLFVGTFADRPPETYRERGAEGPAPDRLLLGSESGFVVDDSFEGRLGRTAGATFADLDNDGDPDLIVSRNVRDVEGGRAPSEIYRNDAGMLVPAAVLDERRGGRAVGVIDFDGDGFDDIVLVEDRWAGASTGVFHNDGDLTFTEVTAETGFPADVFGLGIGIGDLNGDGFDDVVVGGSNRWFLGDGQGFEEGVTSPLPWPLHGDEDDPAHVVLVDTDDDGTLDILMGQHFNSTLDQGIQEPVRLFLGTAGDGGGQPTFDDVTAAVGLPDLATKSPQLLLADIDGDGRHDVVTTASYPDGADGHQPVVITSGLGDGGTPTFTSQDPEADAHYWIDGVTLDANGDGRTDVFLVEWEPALGSRLFLNLPDSAG